MTAASNPTAASSNPSSASSNPSGEPGTGTSEDTGTGETGETGESSASSGTTGSETSETSGPTSSATDPTTMGADTTGTTEPPPTSGPGVLPGEDGMDAFCRRYVECGGTYYSGEQECLDETYGYWGDCPSRKAALDAFGACMSELDCGEWNPDAYNPNSTPCAAQWGDVQGSEPC